MHMRGISLRSRHLTVHTEGVPAFVPRPAYDMCCIGQEAQHPWCIMLQLRSRYPFGVRTNIQVTSDDWLDLRLAVFAVREHELLRVKSSAAR